MRLEDFGAKHSSRLLFPFLGHPSMFVHHVQRFSDDDQQNSRNVARET